MTLHPSTQCLLNNIPVLRAPPTDQPSSPDSHRTAPITLDSFVPCAKTVTGFSSAGVPQAFGISCYLCSQIHAQVFFPRMVRFPWTPQSSFVPPPLSWAASDCPPAPFQAPGSLPSPASLHLLQLGSYLQLACPLPSCFTLSLCLSLKALLPSPFFPLCISDKDSPLWSEQVCPAPHPHSSFPLLLFSLGSLFISSLLYHFPSPWPLILHYHWIPLPLTNFSFLCPLWRCNNIISRHVTSSGLLPLSIRALEAVPAVCACF